MRQYKQIIPILFLSICCIVTVVTAFQGNVILNGESYDFAMSVNHYGGIAGMALAWATFYRVHSKYKYVLFGLFLLGLFRIVAFTPMNYGIGLGFGESRIELDTVAIFFAFLVYVVHAGKINAAIFLSLKPSEQKIQEQEQAEIERYKERFNRKSSAELQEIILTNKLVPAAIKAAKHLLKDKA